MHPPPRYLVVQLPPYGFCIILNISNLSQAYGLNKRIMEQSKSLFSGWRIVFNRKVDGRMQYDTSKYFTSREDAIKWLFSPKITARIIQHASEFDSSHPFTITYSR